MRRVLLRWSYVERENWAGWGREFLAELGPFARERAKLLACSLRMRCNLGLGISPGPRRARTVRAGASQTVGLLSSNMVQPRREDLSRPSQSSGRSRGSEPNCWLALFECGATWAWASLQVLAELGPFARERAKLLACSLRIWCNLGAKISPGLRRAQAVRAGASQTVGLLSSNAVQLGLGHLSRSSQSSDRSRGSEPNCWLALFECGATWAWASLQVLAELGPFARERAKLLARSFSALTHPQSRRR